MMPQASMSMSSMGTPSGFLNPVQPFMMSQDIPNVVSLGRTILSSVYISANAQQIPDDFVMWDMEFWSPLLHNGGV